MVQLQLIFDELSKMKKEQKIIKTLFKDALKNSLDYQDTLTKLTALREKKKKIEAGIQDQYRSELEKIDQLDMDIRAQEELFSDAAITMMMKGETIVVEDEYKQEYEPRFKVKLAKKK